MRKAVAIFLYSPFLSSCKDRPLTPRFDHNRAFERVMGAKTADDKCPADGGKRRAAPLYTYMYPYEEYY